MMLIKLDIGGHRDIGHHDCHHHNMVLGTSDLDQEDAGK